MFLCTLMKVYMTFERVIVLLSILFALFILSNPVWGHLVPFLEQNGTEMVSRWGHFWVDPGHFGVTQGSFWPRFGIVLASSSGRFSAFLTHLDGF